MIAGRAMASHKPFRKPNLGYIKTGFRLSMGLTFGGNCFEVNLHERV